MPLTHLEATKKALLLIEDLRSQYGQILLHYSGGDASGNSPMCYPAREFQVSSSDVLVGDIREVPLYINAIQLEEWRNSRLVVDVIEGTGSMFSLEVGLGLRFCIRPFPILELE